MYRNHTGTGRRVDLTLYQWDGEQLTLFKYKVLHVKFNKLKKMNILCKMVFLEWAYTKIDLRIKISIDVSVKCEQVNICRFSLYVII